MVIGIETDCFIKILYSFDKVSVNLASMSGYTRMQKLTHATDNSNFKVKCFLSIFFIPSVTNVKKCQKNVFF